MEFGFGSLSGSVVKNLPAIQQMQEMWVQFPGWKDPLEEGLATHSSILAWRIPWTEGPHRLPSTGSQRVRHDWNYWAHAQYYPSLSATKILSSSWDSLDLPFKLRNRLIIQNRNTKSMHAFIYKVFMYHDYKVSNPNLGTLANYLGNK